MPSSWAFSGRVANTLRARENVASPSAARAHLVVARERVESDRDRCTSGPSAPEAPRRSGTGRSAPRRCRGSTSLTGMSDIVASRDDRTLRHLASRSLDSTAHSNNSATRLLCIGGWRAPPLTTSRAPASETFELPMSDKCPSHCSNQVGSSFDSARSTDMGSGTSLRTPFAGDGV